jgi:hypothetical protein
VVAFHDIVPGPEKYVGGVPAFWQEVNHVPARRAEGGAIRRLLGHHSWDFTVGTYVHLKKSYFLLADDRSRSPS